MKLQLHYFRQAASSYKVKFFTSTLLALLCAVFNVMIPVLLKWLLQAMANATTSTLLAIGSLITICIVFSIATTITLYISLDAFGGLFLKDMEHNLRNQLLQCSMSFADKKGNDILSHTLYSDTLDVFRVIGHHFPMLMASVLIIVGTFVLSLMGSPYIAGYLLISVCMGIAISMVSRKAIFKASSQTNIKLKGIHELTNQFAQTLLSAKTNSEGNYYKHKFDEAIEDFIETSKREDKKVYLFSGITNNFNLVVEIFLSVLVSIPLAGRSIPNYAFYVFIFSLTMKQAEKIESLLQQIIKSEICFKNVDEILKLKTLSRDVDLDRINSIHFEKVCFGYKPKSQVLSEYSLTLNSGDYLFLKGENGSGKSTILKLIRGFYCTQSGSVLLNNVDINSVKLESLHKNVLYIGQDEVLLNETPIEYLLAVVKPILGADFGVSQAKPILDYVGIEDISSPITHNGESLSGGQRKKLLFAKLIALSETASVILIDELLAGLDVETKAKLDSFINNLIAKKDKIIVVVSHNLY